MWYYFVSFFSTCPFRMNNRPLRNGEIAKVLNTYEDSDDGMEDYDDSIADPIINLKMMIWSKKLFVMKMKQMA